MLRRMTVANRIVGETMKREERRCMIISLADAFKNPLEGGLGGKVLERGRRFELVVGPYRRPIAPDHSMVWLCNAIRFLGGRTGCFWGKSSKIRDEMTIRCKAGMVLAVRKDKSRRAATVRERLASVIPCGRGSADRGPNCRQVLSTFLMRMMFPLSSIMNDKGNGMK